MSTTEPSKGEWWHLPSILKELLLWCSFCGLIFSLVRTVAECFFGAKYGVFAGAFVFAGFVALFFVSKLLSTILHALEEATTMLSTSQYSTNEIRMPVVKDLKRARTFIYIFIVCLLALTLISGYFAFWPSIYHWFYTDTPSAVEFAELKYYRPSVDNAYLQDAAFLEAIIGSLQQEGRAEGKDFQIVVGVTVPFSHPTPAFRSMMEIKGTKFLVTGYAFRKHRISDRNMYEEVPRTFPTEQQVVFEIPPSEDGDEILVLARITRIEGEAFPEDLKKVSSLKPIE